MVPVILLSALLAHALAEDALPPSIIGGYEAQPHAWPWQVSLRISPYWGHYCGGSVISEKWILTAAHCACEYMTIKVNRPEEYRVVLGIHYAVGLNRNDYQNLKSLKSIIVHPQYNPYNFDVALMELSEPVTFSQYISKIALAEQNELLPPGTKVIETGWGVIDRKPFNEYSRYDFPGCQRPVTGSELNVEGSVILNCGLWLIDRKWQVVELHADGLQQVETHVVDKSNCYRMYFQLRHQNGRLLLPLNELNTVICTGEQDGGKESCQGDSGGPVIAAQNGKWVQYGIVSFAKGCAERGFPGVKASVAEFRNWIDSYVN